MKQLRHVRSFTLVAIALSGSACSGYVRQHLALADSFFEHQQYQQSVAEYAKALRLDRDNPHGVRQLGLAYYNLGEVREASIFLLKAADLGPRDIDVRLKLANLYLMARQADRAIDQTSAVLSIAPDNRDALKVRGVAYLINRSVSDAGATFRRMVALDAMDPDAHFLLGTSLLAQEDRTQARREFERALAISPKHVDAAIRIIQLDLEEHRTADALAQAQRTIAVAGSSARLQSVLGAAYAMLQQPVAAESAFVAAIRLDPRQVEARIARADLLGRSGRTSDGLAALDSALRLDSTNVAAFLVQAQLKERAHDFVGARRSYETAGRLAPNDAHVGALYGWFLYERGEYDRAINILSNVALALPNDPTVQYHLAKAAVAVGDTATARISLSRARGLGR